MTEKVYCIVKKGGDYYIPVKAEKNPYPGYEEKEAYLACLPNFFGGKKNCDESLEEALIREVSEESQEKICLQSGRFEMEECYAFSDNKTIRKPGRPDRTITISYKFYLVTVNERGMYFHENCLDMNMEEPEAEKREMRCILKIPVNNDLRGKDVDVFLQLCKNLVRDDRVKINQLNSDGKENTALRDWKADQGTKDAFKVLFGLR